MENRYHDNTSPEPTTVNVQECYKTPTFQQFSTNSVIGFNHFDPTPPSDSDESIHNNSGYESLAPRQADYYTTPKITDNSYYGFNQAENSYRNLAVQPSSVIYNTNKSECNRSFEEPDETNKENESAQQVTNNRFKRRSRTTYTKNQVEIMKILTL